MLLEICVVVVNITVSLISASFEPWIAPGGNIWLQRKWTVPRTRSLWIMQVWYWRRGNHPYWRHGMETISALLALCERNQPATGGFPHTAFSIIDRLWKESTCDQWIPLTKTSNALNLNKLLNKQSTGGDLRRQNKITSCLKNDSLCAPENNFSYSLMARLASLSWFVSLDTMIWKRLPL